MIKLKVEIPNLKDLVEGEVGQIVGQVVSQTAEVMREKHATAKGTGRKYPRGNGKFHIASRPGEIPVVDYGDLLKSIISISKGKEGTISLNEYGWYLEKTRPWIIPSLDEVLANLGNKQNESRNNSL